MESSTKRSLTGFLSRSSPVSSSRDTSSSDITSISTTHDEGGKLGLTTLYEPDASSAVLVDIVFIHGLNGSSRKTWSFSKHPDHYWPKSWLPSDPDFVDARIHVFGYQANWKSRQENPLNIHYIAQTLLGELKNDPGIRRDESSIILVGHSMGGCIAKKAYVMGRQDPSCKGLVHRIHSLFFLGTPHRGSDLAPVLDSILTLTGATKAFIKDLMPNSSALTEMNDTFRHYALDLRLWSFYETQPVTTKLLNRIVVSKASSTLDYPNEEIAAMSADHRHLSRFESRQDPNYRALRNALHTALDMIRAANEEPSVDVASRLMAVLGISDHMDDNLTVLQVLKEPGSCAWFTDMIIFTAWERATGSPILWLTGRPGAGKSVLSSHVVERLSSSPNIFCSYFYFKSGKSTLSECLLSLAHQMASKDATIRQSMLHLLDDQTAWDKMDEAIVWRRIFIGAIFKCPSVSRHCWVIDGVDECTNFTALFTKRLLATVPNQLRIFATSRDLEEIGRGITALKAQVSVHAMSEDDTLEDMRLFLSTKLGELDRLEGDEDREAMCEKILQKSRGSFLWVRLVLQEFENAWTDEAMEAVLEDVPSDLYDVYNRILQSIETDASRKQLAKSIMTWVVLAARPLTTDELRCAIKLDKNQTLQNMAKAVPSLCGQLVYVDQADKVQIIHETARQFLLDAELTSDLAIVKAPAHTRLASLLLGYLSSNVLGPQQAKLAQPSRTKGFGIKAASPLALPTALLSYAVKFFSEHVSRSDPEDDRLMEGLCTFLKSHDILYWIEEVAQGRDLGDITRTAMNIRGYLERRTKSVSPTDPQVHIVESWVVDLIRIAAKFRSQLLSCPSSIHCLIPPLCPPGSIISRTFSNDAKTCPILVKNLPGGSWDDCLIRIDFSTGFSTAITHGDNLFAVGMSNRKVKIYDALSLQLLREFSHSGRVEFLGFSLDDEFIVSTSAKNLDVWNTRTGVSLLSTSLSSSLLAVTFLGPDELLLASERSDLTKWNLETGVSETLSWLELDNSGFSSSERPWQLPSRAIFSTVTQGRDLLMAVAYRSHPVCLWNPLELQFLGRCGSASPNGVDGMAFNPNPDITALIVAEAIGRLCVYDYSTLQLDFEVPRVFADHLACSRDGRTLVTGNSQGVIQIFQFDLGPGGNIILAPIYRVQAASDHIRGVSFSANGLRFVEINRRQCRGWEPAALVRKDKELDSTSEAVPSSNSGSHPQISAQLVASKDGRLIFAGKTDGSIYVWLASDGQDLGVAYRHSGSVLKLEAHHEANLIASADNTGRVLVAQMPDLTTSKSPTDLTPSKIIIDRHFNSVDPRSAVFRLLISPNASRLLVSGRWAHELWDIPSGSLVGTRPSAPETSSPDYSFQHPSDNSLLVIVSGDITRVYQWEGLADVTVPEEGIHLQRPPRMSRGGLAEVYSYHQASNITIEHIAASPFDSAQLIVWPGTAFTTGLNPSSDLAGRPSEDANMDTIGSAVLSVLGISGTSRLVFIDTNFWVCSVDIGSLVGPSPSVTSYGPRILGPSLATTFPRLGRSSIRKKSVQQIGQAARHFFALSEWRNSWNNLCPLMISSPATATTTQHSSHQTLTFAFASGPRVIIIEGGMEFSEMIALNTNSTRGGSRLLMDKKESQEADSPAKSGPSTGISLLQDNHWTVISGSMHRRSSNW